MGVFMHDLALHDLPVYDLPGEPGNGAGAVAPSVIHYDLRKPGAGIAMLRNVPPLAPLPALRKYCPLGLAHWISKNCPHLIIA